MRTEYEIQRLSQDMVFVLTRKYAVVEGNEYQLGPDYGAYYNNSTADRERIAEDLQEPYLSAVMLMWGDAPTMDPSPEEPNEDNPV